MTVFNNLTSDKYVYVAADVKAATPNFVNTPAGNFVRDKWYGLIKIYKEMVFLTYQVTTFANLTGAKIEFAVINEGNNGCEGIGTAPKVAFDSFFADVDIATAVSNQALVFNAGFTKFKPSQFSLADCAALEAGFNISDWNALLLIFKVVGANIPANFMINFKFLTSYQY